MNQGQYEGLMGMLEKILDRMPERPSSFEEKLAVHLKLDHVEPASTKTGWPYDREGPAPVPTSDVGTEATLGDIMKARKDGAKIALEAMLDVAEGWAKTAAENDEAMGRRDRVSASRQPFYLSDMRTMIDDAAREVGLGPDHWRL